MTDPYRSEDDTDGDGIVNSADGDIDGDGISNSEERAAPGPADIDCDGIPHWFDTDSDGDTWPDSVEILVSQNDVDGDGFPNYLDVDSDGDGDSDAIDIPLGEVSRGQILYVETTLVEEGDAKIAQVDVTENFINAVNLNSRELGILLPPNSDEGAGGPRYIEFLVETEEIQFNPVESMNIPGVTCKEIGPPYLCSGSNCSGSSGINSSGWLPWCGRDDVEQPLAVPNRVIHTYRYALDNVSQNLSNQVAVFSVEQLAQGIEIPDASSSGVLEFIEIYTLLPVIDYLTEDPIIFDGTRVQYMPAERVSVTEPYVRSTTIRGGSGTTFEVLSICCSFDEIDYLRSEQTASTLYDYHNTGAMIAVAYPGFFWDRGDDPFGVHFQGVQDTSDEFFYAIENWQVIYSDLPIDI